MTDAERSALSEGLGITVSDEQWVQLSKFKAALYETNATTNLTRVPPEDFLVKHIWDSLLFHDLFPQKATVIDIGCGPGFPAWPLAWARPDLKVTAMDAAGKMVRFLASVPLPNLEVVQGRAEDEARKRAGRFDVATGRALAPLTTQLELSVRFVSVGGLILPLRTPSDTAEADRLAENPFMLRLASKIERALPGEAGARMLPVYEKFGQTPTAFPRRWAEMKAKPL